MNEHEEGHVLYPKCDMNEASHEDAIYCDGCRVGEDRVESLKESVETLKGDRDGLKACVEGLMSANQELEEELYELRTQAPIKAVTKATIESYRTDNSRLSICLKLLIKELNNMKMCNQQEVDHHEKFCGQALNELRELKAVERDRDQLKNDYAKLYKYTKQQELALDKKQERCEELKATFQTISNLTDDKTIIRIIDEALKKCEGEEQ